MRHRVFCWFVLAVAQAASVASAQWYAIPDLQYANVKCLLSVSDSTVFVGGDNFTLLRSTDNGLTWTNVMGNGIQADTILSLGKGGGYIFAGTYGVSSVYRSPDTGSSWTAADQGLEPGLQANAFTWVDSTLYTATTHGVFSSTDYGTSWKAENEGFGLEPPYPGHVGDMAGITSVGSKLYAIKFVGGGVYTSSADSIAWTPIGLDTVWGYAITAIDTNVFAGTPGGVYLYSGSGTRWLPRSNGLPEFLPFCILLTADTLLIAYTGFASDAIYISCDLGQTWTLADQRGFAGPSVNAMAATRTHLVVGTGMGGWRAAITDLLTSVEDGQDDWPGNFILSQNYPNPFNPATIIGYRLPSAGHVTLKVYDGLGREVTTLIDERQDAGGHSIVFNAAGLPTGVYFYRLQAGTRCEVRKLILLK